MLIPPDTGNIVDSSEKQRAIMIIATAPMSHDSIAAGPAIFEAYKDPNSHPEPIVALTEANNMPDVEIPRFNSI
nr:hypothetical protein GTC16762_21140 [Pigmentibacter ruber]